MKLTPMRYKTYTWPHNPEVYTIRFERKLAIHKVPFGGCFAQELGTDMRVLSGEGTFSGPGAYEQFKKLASIFYDKGPGMLSHPVWNTSSAYFVQLMLKQEPLANFVRYTFEFWDGVTAVGIPATSPKGAIISSKDVKKEGETMKYHTVISGDNLWRLATRYGVTVSWIIAHNPQIKNPNLIYPGNRIRVA